jgi:hypothetical protein
MPRWALVRNCRRSVRSASSSLLKRMNFREEAFLSTRDLNSFRKWRLRGKRNEAWFSRPTRVSSSLSEACPFVSTIRCPVETTILREQVLVECHLNRKCTKELEISVLDHRVCECRHESMVAKRVVRALVEGKNDLCSKESRDSTTKNISDPFNVVLAWHQGMSLVDIGALTFIFEVGRTKILARYQPLLDRQTGDPGQQLVNCPVDGFGSEKQFLLGSATSENHSACHIQTQEWLEPIVPGGEEYILVRRPEIGIELIPVRSTYIFIDKFKCRTPGPMLSHRDR